MKTEPLCYLVRRAREILMSKTYKDPVCGMTVLSERVITSLYNHQTIYFCSEYCQNKFLERPDRYLASLVTPSDGEANVNRKIAYFSMEVAISQSIPTYSGGLGVLAEDTLMSCADLRVPIVGVTFFGNDLWKGK